MCETLTLKERSECSGGEGCCIYKRTDLVPSFDKGDHKERSIAESPVHRKHWKKVERKQKENL